MLATDAPLSSRQLAAAGDARRARARAHRLGRRTTAAARSSSRSAPARGCRARPDSETVFHRNLLRDEVLNPFFAAAVEATEEAVINCLVAADTVIGHDGHAATGIPLDRLTEIMRAPRPPPPASLTADSRFGVS